MIGGNETPADLRRLLEKARRDLTLAQNAQGRAESALQAVRAVLNPTRDLAVEVAELLAYAVQCKTVQAGFADLIAQLRALPNAEATAIGNSMDALFRAAPVPVVLARR